MPEAETILWARLKNRQVLATRFRRQFGVGPYSLDFYSPDVKLAIEVDGDSHYLGEAPKKDAARQKFIEEHGIRVLRFTNNEIRNSMDAVLVAIASAISEQLEKG